MKDEQPRLTWWKLIWIFPLVIALWILCPVVMRSMFKDDPNSYERMGQGVTFSEP
jgi:hypothetical protein